MFLYYFILYMDPFRFSPSRGWPTSDPALSVRALAYRMNREGVTNAPGPYDWYVLLYFYDGALVGSGGPPRWCPPGSFVVFAPGSPAFFGNTRSRWTHTWMHIRGHAVADLFRTNLVPLNRPFPLDSPEPVERCVLDLYQEITRHPEPDREIAQSVLRIFVRHLRRCLVPAHRGQSDIPARLVEVRNRIETRYHESLTLHELARHAALTPAYFGARFRHYFGVPPIELVVRLRLEEAVRLLGDVNLNITEVARQVGYDDVYYFSKLFKKRFGVSPLTYRKGQADARR